MTDELWWSDQRPYFARVPNCAWCDWDWHTDLDQLEWVYAAYLPGPGTRLQRPDEHWVWDHNYVGWLCDECAQDGELTRWFGDEVVKQFPTALFVKFPGTPHEQRHEVGAPADLFLVPERDVPG